MSDISSQLAPLAQLQQLMSGANTLDLSQVVHAYAQQISAQSTMDIAAAISELTSLGVDPDKYIAPSKQHVRNQREQVRIQHEQAMLQQQLEHQARLNEIEIRRAAAATELQELTVASAKSTVNA